jgi:hypothetical protein
MKTLIYLIFLLPAGASVYSQSAQPAYPPLAPAFPPFVPAPHLLPFPTPGNSLLPSNQGTPILSTPQLDITFGSPGPRVYSLLSPNSIHFLQPDNMPCLVTDLSLLERMPVKRTKNADRMPNAIKSPK